jgi:hypothetical protein
MKEDSICCFDSVQVNLEGCTLLDPQQAFFYMDKKGSINVTSSKLKQSNSSIPISEIYSGEKITIMNSKIEWKGNLDYSTAFKNASLVVLRNNNLNERSLPDYFFQKQEE